MSNQKIYGAFWKGQLIEKFDSIKEAKTFIDIENTQMEYAEYTAKQLNKYWKIKEI